MTGSSSPLAFLETEASSCPPHCVSHYESLKSLYERKLWHQLTVALTSFLSDSGNESGGSFHRIWTEFVSHFERKINQLELAKIAVRICEVYEGEEGGLEKGESLLAPLLGQKEFLPPSALLFVTCSHALLLLRLDPVKNAGAVKKVIEDGRSTLENLGDVVAAGGETSCHKQYYRLSMEYHKVIGPPEAFYKNGLMFLSFTPSSTLSREAQHDLARDLSLAALSGSDIFNFGEVFETPILQVLRGTSDEWLLKFMEAFCTGDVNAYNSTMKACQEQFNLQPALANKATFIHEKITLLALVNMVFSRPPSDRTISFDEISVRAQVPVDQVEWVVMKALSLKLIKGKMDQIAGTVTITWVVPRVLNGEQIKEIIGKIREWKERVKTYENVVRDETVEMLA